MEKLIDRDYCQKKHWHCGELDGNKELMEFADKLEKATLSTIESGKMTGDLQLMTTLENTQKLNTEDFILAIKETLENM